MFCQKKEKRYREIIDDLSIRNLKMSNIATTDLKNWHEKKGLKIFCFAWNMGASVS